MSENRVAHVAMGTSWVETTTVDADRKGRMMVLFFLRCAWYDVVIAAFSFYSSEVILNNKIVIEFDMNGRKSNGAIFCRTSSLSRLYHIFAPPITSLPLSFSIITRSVVYTACFKSHVTFCLTSLTAC